MKQVLQLLHGCEGIIYVEAAEHSVDLLEQDLLVEQRAVAVR